MDSVFDIVERHWTHAPVPIQAIIRDAGIHYREDILTPHSFGSPEVSGYIEKRGDQYTIVVNLQHPNVRRRFTAAHELGHYVYHRDLMGNGVSDNKVYRSAPGTPFYNPRIQSHHETQANQFAATVLMPLHLIKTLRSQGLDVAAMARALEVSEAALKIRLGMPA